MQIDAVNPGHAYGWQKAHGNATQLEDPPEAPPGDTTGELTEDEPTESDGATGVIRLLQEGHFKGVSDLRLRINFFDELEAMKTAQVEAVTQEKLATLTGSVAGVVDAFIDGNDLTEEQEQQITAFEHAFEQSVNGSLQDPLGGLNNAFADLIAALQTLFEPPAQPETEESPPDSEEPEGGGEEEGPVGAAEAPPEEPADAPPEPEPSPDWLGFIDNLQAAFTSAMDDLNTGLSSVEILPPLSPPTGNGVAYEKFLAIYNQMRGLGTVEPEPPAEPEPVPLPEPVPQP